MRVQVFGPEVEFRDQSVSAGDEARIRVSILRFNRSEIISPEHMRVWLRREGVFLMMSDPCAALVFKIL